MSVTPLVVDLKRGSLDDGPGIRSVLFFKGCPLRCVWCHNPEAISPKAQLQRNPEACVGCRTCEQVCPRGVARSGAHPEERSDCLLCGLCARRCPAGARRLVGQALPVDEVVAQLLEDEPFYRRSGGGVTLSGGEPTQYPVFSGQIAAAMRGHGVHVLLETCGHFAWRAFAEHLLPHLDTVYFDLKLADPDAHRTYCGRDNALIHENLQRLVEDARVELLPRVPLIPGITDSQENLKALGELIRRVGLERVSLMPYNPLWLSKRRGLGMELPYEHAEWMSAETVAACEDAMRGLGLTAG